MVVPPPPLVPVIQQWGRNTELMVSFGLTCVQISRMKQETHLRWNEPETISSGFQSQQRIGARRYINNAPPEVDTPLRRQCRKLVGCNLVPTWFQRSAENP